MSKLLILSLLLLASTLATSTRILNDVTQISDSIPLSETDISTEVEPDVVAPIATTTPSTNVNIPTEVEPEVVAPIATTTPSTNVNVAPIPDDPAPIIAPVADIPDTDAPPLNTVTPTTNVAVAPIPDEAAPLIAPVPDIPPQTTPTAATSTTNEAVAPIPDKPAPVIAPAPDLPKSDAPPLTTPIAATGGAAAADSPTFSFFMHDILGGSNPSGRAVAGIVASSDANNLPFSKTSNQFFPINGGVPLNTVNGVVNNNNLPFLVGLNGNPSNTVVQNNGNNLVSGGGNQPFVTAGQLPAGLTLQQLTFGSVTVVDNELTAGHELGSAVLGRAQGMYLTSSSDGSSHTLLLTAAFHAGEHAEIFDTLSFFGVHRTATPISDIAIVGGTGKYENAKGFAAIETLPHVDQHTTDGVETITHFTIYLTP